MKLYWSPKILKDFFSSVVLNVKIILPFSKNLEQWRREHQKSGRELSKKITSSIKARGLQSLKEEGYAEFEMQGYEGPHVSAYVVNSCEIVHHIPLSSTKKLIRKNSG